MSKGEMVTYAVVQSRSREKKRLCVLPSTWLFMNGWLTPGGIDDGKGKYLGNDKGFWPKADGDKDFDRALRGEIMYPSRMNAKPFRCMIKRSNLQSKADADKEILRMLGKPETDETTDEEFLQNSALQGTSKAEKDISKLMAKLIDQPDPFACILESASQQPSKPLSKKPWSDSIFNLQTPPARPVHQKHHLNSPLSEDNMELLGLQNEVVSLKRTVAELNKQLSECKKTLFDGPAQKVFVDELKRQMAEQIKHEFERFNLEALAKSVVDAVALINAKCDAIGHGGTVGAEARIERPNQSRVLVKCNTTNDLIKLNESAKDRAFVNAVVFEQGEHYGPNNATNLGRSVALNIIDNFVARPVFVDCCWTGRGKRTDKKIAFGQLTDFIHMFYEVVKVSDPVFTPEMTNLFFKDILSTAVQRAQAPNPKIKPSQRSRVKNPRKRSAPPAAITSADAGPSKIMFVSNNEDEFTTDTNGTDEMNQQIINENFAALPDGQQIHLVYTPHYEEEC